MDPAGEGTQLHAPSLADGTTLGGYVIGECIGIGGFGEVYRAKHAVIGREVAVKVLHRRYSHDAEAIARFVAEARAVNKVSHPGIVEIHDFGTVEGRQYCVMELVKGTTLRDKLRATPRLTLDEALPILRGVADAVDAAHGAGVAHRDIKPDNIFITSDGVKLIDFGLAKLTRGDDAVPVTQTGAVFGTPLYMSPEQCRGKNIDLRTDQYSFGVVAYQMLTGAPPFSGDALELALHHLNDPPKPPAIDERVDRVLLALLAKDPAERPASVREAIDAMVGEAPLPTVRLRRPGRAWWMMGAVAAITVAGGVWFATKPGVSPVASDPCQSGASRLQGIWDVPMRSLVAGRFDAVRGEEVRASWSALAQALDGYAAGWTRQWDAACHSKDKQADPLLYAQRETCLDNAHVALQGVTQSLLRADVANFSESFTGDFVLPVLADCESVPVLRVQKPAPPPERREQVAAQLIETYAARGEMRAAINSLRMDGVDHGLARLAHAIEELERLHPPAAVEPAYWRAAYLDNPTLHKLDEGGKALAYLHALATRVGDDRAQAMAYYEDAVANERSIGDAATSEHFLDLGDEAATRAGKPALATLLLTKARGELELRTGRIDAAIEHLTAATRAYEAIVPVIGGYNGHEALVRALVAAGRYDDAITSARDLVTTVETSFGHHIQLNTTRARRTLVLALAHTKPDEALEEGWHTLDQLAVLKHLPIYRDDVRELVAAMFTATPNHADIDRLLARYGEALHAGRALTGEELMQLSGMLYGQGDVDGAAETLERELAVKEISSHDRAMFSDTAAYLAYIRGDAAHARELATAALAAEPQEIGARGWSTGILAWVDAVEGRRAAAEARIAAAKGGPDAQFAFSFALAAFGRWRDVAARAEAYLKLVPKEAVPDRAELNGWIGIAREEAGDHAGALAPLEQSLVDLYTCCGGRHYPGAAVRFALARALVATGGDRKRAHDLAVVARDTTISATEKKRIEEWLSANP